MNLTVENEKDSSQANERRSSNLVFAEIVLCVCGCAPLAVSLDLYLYIDVYECVFMHVCMYVHRFACMCVGV